MGNTFGFLLISADRGAFYSLLSAVGVAVNVSLNFLLIPTFGIQGAAYATVVTDLVTTLMAYIYVTERVCRIQMARMLLGVLFASGMTVLFLTFFPFPNLFILSLAGLALYLLILCLSRNLLMEDFRLIQAIIKDP